MKYSEALRKAATIFTPVQDVWFKSATEACAVAAMVYVITGEKENITPSFGNADYTFSPAFEAACADTHDVPATNFPVSEDELRQGWKKFWDKAPEPEMKTMPFPKKLSIGVVVMILNDGLGMEWSKIADWLESIGA